MTSDWRAICRPIESSPKYWVAPFRHSSVNKQQSFTTIYKQPDLFDNINLAIE